LAPRSEDLRGGEGEGLGAGLECDAIEAGLVRVAARPCARCLGDDDRPVCSDLHRGDTGRGIARRERADRGGAVAAWERESSRAERRRRVQEIAAQVDTTVAPFAEANGRVARLLSP
jgi:hypothetical protein